MEHLGYYEQVLGMGNEPSYVSRLGATAITGALGAFVATRIAPKKDTKQAIVGGAISAIGVGAVGQAIFPLTGVLYWDRAVLFTAGAGALVGLYLKNQYEREMAYATEMRSL
jgi:cyanate permease